MWHKSNEQVWKNVVEECKLTNNSVPCNYRKYHGVIFVELQYRYLSSHLAGKLLSIAIIHVYLMCTHNLQRRNMTLNCFSLPDMHAASNYTKWQNCIICSRSYGCHCFAYSSYLTARGPMTFPIPQDLDIGNFIKSNYKKCRHDKTKTPS